MAEPIKDPNELSVRQKAWYCENVYKRLANLPDDKFAEMDNERIQEIKRLSNKYGYGEVHKYYYYHVLVGSTENIMDFDSEHIDFSGDDAIYSFMRKLEDKYLR